MTYVRPHLATPVFRDADGNVIEYGNRWGDGPPPKTSYSVDTNLERFAPLHAVADALIAHLVERYDVDVAENPSVAEDFMREPTDVQRAVRIVPRSELAAPLTFVHTAYPSVTVHAGLLHDLGFPDCGCDACDETWEDQAEEMEWQVLAVAAGRFRESVAGRRHPWIAHELASPEGEHVSGRSQASGLPKDRLAAARRVLRGLPDGWWAAWPERRR